MIRTSYPISPMKHLRLRLDLATRQTRRTLEQRRRTLLTEVSGTERLKTATGTDLYLLLRWRNDVKRQRAIFDTFYDQYDALIGLLCAAAQMGIEAGMEDEYRIRQTWFAGNYGQRVQALLGPFLSVGAAPDTDTGIPVRAGLRGRQADSFEALYLPETIAVLLAADGGSLIGRMMDTQTVLGSWEAHIARQEAAITSSLRFH